MCSCFYSFPFSISTCGQIATPLVYSEDLSIAQQIAHLFSLFQQANENAVSKDEFNKFLEWLAAEEEAQGEALRQYVDSTASDLRELIEKLEAGMLQFDPQNGRFEDTKTAQYDMFNDLAVHALTVYGLANSDYTVESLTNSGMSVRGLAVFSGTFTNPQYIDPSIEA